jgi:bifunctional non-homologous end joining protein LigD
MSLDRYRAKRRFDVTPEPAGEAPAARGMSFVIQKHAARRLHYDLRLEWDGVLLSWAVTRGPSLVPGDKRLAVQVEDHPLDYRDFEGIIPKGEYGAGSVIVWDRGTWTPKGDVSRGLKKGHLDFDLSGEKLLGGWHLVRMARKTGESRDNWLLIKADDDAAQAPDAGDILEERPESVLTDRSLDDVAAARPARKGRGKSRAAALPDFLPPALATLASRPPAGEDWLHEIKFDGYRLAARIDRGEVRLVTRGGLDWTSRFGERIRKELAGLPVTSAYIDGEAVVETAAGASDFSALQADLSEGREDRFVLWLFDLLHLDGKDLTRQPLTDRRAALRALLPDRDGDVLRFSAEFTEPGEMVLRHACRLSLEGIVSKRRDAPYRSGRSRAWTKSKCVERQEFVIGGFVPSTVDSKAVGSLLLGVNEAEGLVHVGRVGTGFAQSAARDLFARLARLRQEAQPFAAPLTSAQARGAVFVRPELVAEVEFRAWTADGHLRHAAFRGLREDKPASQITRETAGKEQREKPAATPRRRVALTHPERIYWPDAGVSKEGLADYYAEVWRRIAPHISGRPLALLRCPTGIDGPQFFQKHAWAGARQQITRITDPAAPDEKPLVGITDLDGLISLVQAAVLEIHPWGATTADLDHPDLIVMDLDPGEGVTWDRIKAAALEVRDRLEAAGLSPFLKTSGGSGLHVVAPLTPRASWDATKTWTRALARSMTADSPADYVATIAKAKRKGRILIDYLRNQRGATAVAPYSTRARPGAKVSMPLDWDELKDLDDPGAFTVASAPARIGAQDRDPWEDFRKRARPLPGKT